MIAKIKSRALRRIALVAVLPFVALFYAGAVVIDAVARSARAAWVEIVDLAGVVAGNVVEMAETYAEVWRQ